MLIYRCCSWALYMKNNVKETLQCLVSFSLQTGVVLFLLHILVSRIHSLPVQILASGLRELPIPLPSYKKKKKVWSASDIDYRKT